MSINEQISAYNSYYPFNFSLLLLTFNFRYLFAKKRIPDIICLLEPLYLNQHSTKASKRTMKFWDPFLGSKLIKFTKGELRSQRVQKCHPVKISFNSYLNIWNKETVLRSSFIFKLNLSSFLKIWFLSLLFFNSNNCSCLPMPCLVQCLAARQVLRSCDCALPTLRTRNSETANIKSKIMEITKFLSKILAIISFTAMSWFELFFMW